MTTNRRIGAALTLAGLLTLVGCSGDGTVDEDLREWMARVEPSLSDPQQGRGGAGGLPGSVTLGSIPTGDYEVWATCEGPETLGIVVSSSGETLAESDLVCGEVAVIPVTTTTDEITIATEEDVPEGYWAAYVNEPGRMPDG